MKMVDCLKEKHGEDNVVAHTGGVVVAPWCDCEHCED